MGRGTTIAINLYAPHIEVLERLAKRCGSRSAAVQRLLEEETRREAYRELDEAYRAYFAQPGAAEAERGLTEQMLSIAAWPEEWLQKEDARGGRKGKKR